jgi:hypothetical protein
MRVARVSRAGRAARRSGAVPGGSGWSSGELGR